MIINSPTLIQLDKKITPVNLYDIIELEKINERKIQISKISGYKIPTNNTNPVFKIASALLLKKPNKLGVNIDIQKNIPTFSGLNSQISNAASVLVALNKLWNFNLNQKELLNIAKNTDPRIEQFLKIYFRSKKSNSKNIILVRPKYIKIDKNWVIDRQSAKSDDAKSIILKHFPDIKEIIKILKNQNLKNVGINGIGSAIVGYSKETINVKKINKILNDKIDFIWIGQTCDNIKL